MKPDRTQFTKTEWDIIEKHQTPRQVQKYLRTISYNFEEEGETVLSFRQVVRRKKGHCL